MWHMLTKNLVYVSNVSSEEGIEFRILLTRMLTAVPPEPVTSFCGMYAPPSLLEFGVLEILCACLKCCSCVKEQIQALLSSLWPIHVPKFLRIQEPG